MDSAIQRLNNRGLTFILEFFFRSIIIIIIIIIIMVIIIIIIVIVIVEKPLWGGNNIKLKSMYVSDTHLVAC